MLMKAGTVREPCGFPPKHLLVEKQHMFGSAAAA